MKYCSKCGHQIMDETIICPNCGCAVEGVDLSKFVNTEVKPSGLKKAAKVLMIISTVFFGLYLIPLAWFLPMTISYCNKINRGQKISTGFKICILLFVNSIAGILLLCDNED